MLLSTQNLSLAIRVEDSVFFTPYSKLWVHGSWIRQAFWTIRTSHGNLLKVELDARRPMFNGSRATRSVTIDDIHFRFVRTGLTVTSRTWRTKATATRGSPHYGVARINIEIQPLHDVEVDRVAPHGLLGQTYDSDDSPLHGKRDRYDILDNGKRTHSRERAGGHVTTRAQAEGAIEGRLEMYRIQKPFDTSFAFSRFGLKAASPRNITALLSIKAMT